MSFIYRTSLFKYLNVSKFYIFMNKNNGPRFELSKTGVLGPVVLHGVGDDSRDITHQKWSYQVCFISKLAGSTLNSNYISISKRELFSSFWAFDTFLQIGLKGESKNLASPTGMSSVEWTELSLSGQIHRPLTWYKVRLLYSLAKEWLGLLDVLWLVKGIILFGD